MMNDIQKTPHLHTCEGKLPMFKKIYMNILNTDIPKNWIGGYWMSHELFIVHIFSAGPRKMAASYWEFLRTTACRHSYEHATTQSPLQHTTVSVWSYCDSGQSPYIICLNFSYYLHGWPLRHWPTLIWAVNGKDQNTMPKSIVFQILDQP